ncbi:uncharacterized protein LOC122505636 isoform X2 [Leptopilina heterotoma]|uniref:uncharacterized protein LOC122505636 isoform X2 n=1 Tax=Leptopilina heterotoma TaxID=63436 RepID=UPI001CA7BE97|nr:uncharacterized protein LOC122505636 isoform X2 [Leptopilina heterotoma]
MSTYERLKKHRILKKQQEGPSSSEEEANETDNSSSLDNSGNLRAQELLQNETIPPSSPSEQSLHDSDTSIRNNRDFNRLSDEFSNMSTSNEEVSNNEEAVDNEEMLGDEELNILQNFSTKLQIWANNNIRNITRDCLTQLLKLLKGEGHDVPISAATLLQTRNNLQIIRPMESAKGKMGKYIYYGIENNLKMIIPENYNKNVIKLLFNVDGVPIFRNSSLQFWIFSARVIDNEYESWPFVVAAFCGDSKPISIKMEFQETTTHLIVNFNVSNDEGQLMVDLVPKRWVHYDENYKKYCKYPTKKDYCNVPKWSKECADPKKHWISYEVVILSEANTYKQGLRRLKRSYNDDQIASSNWEKSESSATESEELKSSTVSQILDNVTNKSLVTNRQHSSQKRSKLDKFRISNSSSSSMDSSLKEKKKIPKKRKISNSTESTIKRSKKEDHLSRTNQTLTDPESSGSRHNSRISNFRRDDRKTETSHHQDNSLRNNQTLSDPESSGSRHNSRISNFRRDDRKTETSHHQDNSPRNNQTLSDPESSGSRHNSRLSNFRRDDRKIETSHHQDNSLRNNQTLSDPESSGSRHNSRISNFRRDDRKIETSHHQGNASLPLQTPKSVSRKEDISAKGVTLNFHCPSCGQSTNFNNIFAEDIIDIKTILKSNKRSIQYDIKKGINELLMAIKGKDTVKEINSVIYNCNTLLNLPKKNVEEFQKFDAELETDDAKLKSFKTVVTIHSQNFKKLEDAVSSILSKVITKEVQIQYSGFGRVVKGVGKLNFSKTCTCKIIQDVLLSKYENTSNADILTKISRWLSGAPDRDGGKKERRSQK